MKKLQCILSLLAESKAELQAALNAMYLYCKCWKLEVNVSKTKIVIFRKRTVKFDDDIAFTNNNQNIDIVDDFFISWCYLFHQMVVLIRIKIS